MTTKHHLHAELEADITRCPHCRETLRGAIVTRPRAGQLPAVERVHVHAGVYASRRPIGVRIVGECSRHGMVEHFPMTRAALEV